MVVNRTWREGVVKDGDHNKNPSKNCSLKEQKMPIILSVYYIKICLNK